MRLLLWAAIWIALIYTGVIYPMIDITRLIIDGAMALITGVAS